MTYSYLAKRHDDWFPLHKFNSRQCTTSSWNKGQVNTNTLLIHFNPTNLSCFRLNFILFVKCIQFVVLEVFLPWLVTEVNWRDLLSWLVVSSPPPVVCYLLLNIFLLFPCKGYGKAKNTEVLWWGVLTFQYHSGVSSWHSNLFQCQNSRTAVGLASQWPSIPAPTWTDIFPPGFSPPLGWINTIRENLSGFTFSHTQTAANAFGRGSRIWCMKMMWAHMCK